MSRKLRVAITVLSLSVFSEPAMAGDYPYTLAGCLDAATDQLAACIDFGFGYGPCTNTYDIVNGMCHQQYAT